MSFIVMKRTIGFKIEGTAYSGETLNVNDYDVPAYNINYDPEIAMYARKLARGDFSRDTSIAGKRSCTISFSVDVAYSGTVQTPPTYYKCLQACGMLQTVHGSTGVSLVPHADYSNVPATIEVVEKDDGASPSQLVIKATGCMGNARFIMDEVGTPVRIEFEFQGVLDGITDRAYGSLISPTGFDSNLPDAILGVTLTVFSETMKLNTVTIDLGNQVEIYTDPSRNQGVDGARIVDRIVTMEADPDMDLIANRGLFARHTGNTEGAFLMEVGDNIQLSAPKCQLVESYKPGDREGHVVNNLRFELHRDTNGNDEFEILQGSKT